MNNSYQFAVMGIIPATQEAFKKNSVSESVRKKESDSLKKFKVAVSSQIKTTPPPKCFPT